MGSQQVAKASDIAPGQMIGVKVDDTGVLIANVDGNYYAITSKCTHRGCNLSKGNLTGTIVTCPCHYSKFDVTYGNVVHGPAAKPERALNVRVENDTIFIDE